MVANRFPAATTGTSDESGTGNEDGNGIPRRIEPAYRDNPVVETDEEDPASRSLEALANRNRITQSRSGNDGPVMQPSRLHEGNNEWAHE